MTFDSAISMIIGSSQGEHCFELDVSLFRDGNAVGTQTVSNTGNSYTSPMVTGLFDFVTIQGSNCMQACWRTFHLMPTPVPLPARLAG